MKCKIHTNFKQPIYNSLKLKNEDIICYILASLVSLKEENVKKSIVNIREENVHTF